jgi:hypothetical protein
MVRVLRPGTVLLEVYENEVVPFGAGGVSPTDGSLVDGDELGADTIASSLTAEQPVSMASAKTVVAAVMIPNLVRANKFDLLDECASLRR